MRSEFVGDTHHLHCTYLLLILIWLVFAQPVNPPDLREQVGKPTELLSLWQCFYLSRYRSKSQLMSFDVSKRCLLLVIVEQNKVEFARLNFQVETGSCYLGSFIGEATEGDS